jgi:hypothetical protein
MFLHVHLCYYVFVIYACTHFVCLLSIHDTLDLLITNVLQGAFKNWPDYTHLEDIYVIALWPYVSLKN